MVNYFENLFKKDKYSIVQTNIFLQQALFNYGKKIPCKDIKILEYEYSVLCDLKESIKNLKILKTHNFYFFNCLTCISGSDFPENKNRFEIAYELLSLHFNKRVRLKIFSNQITPVESATSLYPSANWWEREIWDLFGVFFQKHPDLRRILTDYGFEGHPLRKDFPLTGYYEVLFSEKTKRVIVQAIEQLQNFRLYDSRSPWCTLA